MTWPATTSKGCPWRSYMASRNKGSMTTIIANVAGLDPTDLRSKKKSGTPTSTAAPKHTSCRRVSPNSTLLFTFVRSFGTVTYAKLSSLQS